MERKSIDEIFAKYGAQLQRKVESSYINFGDVSREYIKFKKDLAPELSRYEKLCHGLGNILQLKISEKDRKKIQDSIDTAHLDVNPSQTLTLAVVSMLSIFFIGVLVSLFIFLLPPTGKFPFILLFLSLIFSMFLFYYFYTMPSRLANKWRLKAGSQMVPCILYIVAYMKHTSNLERAVAFAAQHLSPPLSLELRKVFWDVETGKYSSIRQSLDAYLETWRKTNIEFVESFHLIESSLYEPSESRRVQVLERALQVILDGVYEKMLRYSREIRSPLTNLYFLGILLPILAITLLPLSSILLGEMLRWYHIFIVFNILIPFLVFFWTYQVLLKRPGGYGESEILEMNPNYYKFNSKKPYMTSFLTALPFLLLGLLPFIFQTGIFGIKDYTFSQLGINFFGDMSIFYFVVTDNGRIAGPFGLVAVLLSLFIPFSIALFFSMVYNSRTKELIKDRDRSKELELEFTNSLFQLGNRLGDGLPAEIAFARVAESTRGQVTEGFFRTVNTNIQQLGMGLEEAIFNKRRGAIIYYPSSLISTSMKILIESVKKGLQVAARSLMSISEYIKNINKINERMRDLMAEVISDMKNSMVFTAPLLAGIVIGLGSMIAIVLIKLKDMFEATGDFSIGAFGSVDNLLHMFAIENIIPPYFVQLVIGIFLVEVVFILSNTLVTVDAGEDKLKTVNETGKNLGRGIIIYLIFAFIAILSLALLAIIALEGLG